MPESASFALAALGDKGKKHPARPAHTPVFTHRARLKHKDIAYDLSDICIAVRHEEKGIFVQLESLRVTVREEPSAVPEKPQRLGLIRAGGTPAWVSDEEGAALCDEAGLLRSRPIAQNKPDEVPRQTGAFPLLDGWSIGLAPGPDFACPGCRADFLYNRVLWQTRRGQDNAISLTSPGLVLPGKGAYSGNALVVTLSDIFGNESRLAVPL
jgi:hypothetical protein